LAKIIGITGSIGSGKSRVCSYLAEQTGWPLIDVDKICRQLLEPEAAGWLALRHKISKEFFTASGEIDRKRLRTALFADSKFRQQLDRLLHPLAQQEMKAQALAQACPFVLAEIPLLFEAGWQDSVALTIVVSAPKAVCLQRIMARDKVTEAEACQALAAQMPIEEKMRRADYLITNGANWSKTCAQLQQLLASKTIFSAKILDRVVGN
jgi:dephospho-CoA kinase